MRPNGPGATFRVWFPLAHYVTWRRTARAAAIMAMTVALGTTVSAAPAAGPGTGALPRHRRPAGLVREPAHGAGRRGVHPHPDRRGRRGSAARRTARAGAIFSAARLADRGRRHGHRSVLRPGGQRPG